MTCDAGQCGRSPYGIVVASASRLAKSPRPEPSTTATSAASDPGTRAFTAATASSTFWRYVISHSQQESRDRRGDEVRQGAGEHRAQSEARQVVAPRRRERADAADLDADRAEVGEAAQRERGDRERLRI